MSKIFDWKLNIDESELQEVCSELKNGKLIVFPTETVYGIGTDAFNGKACAKIYKAKGRPSDNPLIVHVSDIEMLKECAKNISEIEQKLIASFMPGPFTLILDKKDIVPNEVTSNLDTVAIRMPNNKIANRIIKSFGRPIAAPSANKSGKPSGTKIADIKDELEKNVSVFIDGGNTEIGLESTVVRVIDDVPVILRPGAVTKEDILSVIEKVKIDEHVLNEVKEDEQVLSPGMKHTHYSPKTNCVLLNLEDAEDKREIANILKNKNVAIIGLDSSKKNYDGTKFINIGTSLEDFSKNIFAKLRELDEFNYDLIFIESVTLEGIGLAIMNRVIRTCGYNVVSNENQLEEYIKNM